MRFISGITSNGQVFFTDTLSALCSRVYNVDDRYGLGAAYLDEIAKQAQIKGIDFILCPNPLHPTRAFAILIPTLSLGFVAWRENAPFPVEPYRHVRLDAIVDVGRLRLVRKKLRLEARIQNELMRMSTDSLGSAKLLHDELEQIYNPYIDFCGVRFLAEECFFKALKNSTQATVNGGTNQY